MKIIQIAVVVFLLVSPVRAVEQPRDPDICNKMDLVVQGLGGGNLVWIGYPDGWTFPDDTVFQEAGRVSFEDDTAVWKYTSPSANQDYVFYFKSIDLTNPDGQHPGLHDFCGPYVMQH